MQEPKPGRHAVIYISHGAGPLPLLGDEGHAEMVANLKVLTARIPRPSAILVISAHWEESAPTVTMGDRPPLYYDYYGFPPESYEIAYPAPGDDALSQAVRDALAARGLPCGQEPERGYDHGLFVPLKIMYPEADIPCVQLSLLKGLDPAAHLALGRALADLDRDNLLILGSGFSFHNMRAFFTPDTAETADANDAFQRWLIETCADPALTPDERGQRLVHWESAPHARYCHPREEHLLPLHVCCGAAGRPCDEHFRLTIIGKGASTFLWRPTD
ncbi:Extradiol ring-cleavage dioxygenase class III protein subunit B [Pseudodesulfovibrio mercurii]|uniref:Extradiol ring-cleavage dioxygenase class III protein subunit B n=1 Tax=Pseudodesulfovibrio mercurii TaxID=641491 RepID=F0JDF3_9BACT|nr:class III extradiol ring-cleavage dioxygenase [Pseudodesulfovibrio mercurii]EGB13322.1 Extradiol ring-cleavage dioxygenase class III protein subunit B [Pseudodesulfovibrio mercurii]